ncbi:helix-turn-helix domain-containing protein [Longibacter sp.]|jgi:transcriptional regulator with XRE-family HTH domain|uniref:helix-turn-helix domain-containing protein n=1 Tax=Longibacter sp. TaxID=2045415 RepID=UPI003EC121B3
MPADSAAGERFARDMRRVREARDLTQNDIHEETRIAVTLIDAFERDGLFEHPAFNRVYLRSFVRAYAGCINVDADRALSHLERALQGAYQNELAVQELGDAPEAPAVDEEIEEPEDTDADESPPTQRDRPRGSQERTQNVFDPRPVGSSSSDASSTDPSRSRSEREADDRSPSAPAASDRDDRSTSESRRETPTQADASDRDDPEGASPGDDADSPLDRTVDDGPSHVADSSVGLTADARRNTGDVFNKRPITDEGEEAEDDEKVEERGPTEASSEDERDPGHPALSSPDESTGGEASGESTDPSSESKEKETDSASPGARFRAMREGDDDAPPPPAHGEMVGTPRPVGADRGDASRDAEASSPSPLTQRERQERAAQDTTGSGIDFLLENRRSITIGGGAVAALLAIGLVWFMMAGSPDADESAASEPRTDTTAQPATAPEPEPQRPPLANLAIGDTIYLILQAERDVSGIRIQRDNDLRRPYWINEGEYAVFPFTDRIIVWDQLENVDVLLENYPYPETTDVRGRLVITRDSAQTFADTVRGSPAQYSTPPDTFRLSPQGLQ